LIYGFAIPMHFFPIVVWNTIKPIFIRKWFSKRSLRSSEMDHFFSISSFRITINR
jgi:hypothetical protein